MLSSKQKSDVSQTLQNILKSPGFKQAPQMSRFLEYVVQKTLNGDEDEIKGYSIGVDALGRNSEFDPQTDPIVRVMAGRLRQALEKYLRLFGGDSSVFILIPKGSYIPEFEFSERNTEKFISNMYDIATPKKSTDKGFLHLTRPNLRIVAIIVFIVGLGGYLITTINWNRADRINYDSAAIENNKFTQISVAVQANGGLIPNWITSKVARSTIVTALSRFREFSIHPVTPDNKYIGSDKLLADYHLSVLLTRSGTTNDIRAFIQLVRQSSGRVIWSRQIQIEKSVKENIDPVNDASQVLGPLVSPYGVIYSDIAKRASFPKPLACITKIYSYFAIESASEYRKSRNCAEMLKKNNMATSSIYALLAILYAEEYSKNIAGYDGNPLIKAATTAAKAVELDPHNARSHQAAFYVNLIQGNQQLAIKSITRALELNPHDSDIISTYATFLVQNGEFSIAEPQVKKALSLNDTNPARLLSIAFILAEFSGQYEKADNLALSLNPEHSTLAAAAMILYATRHSKPQVVARAIEMIAKREPEFVKDTLASLVRRGFSSDLARKFAAKLIIAGVGNGVENQSN